MHVRFQAQTHCDVRDQILDFDQVTGMRNRAEHGVVVYMKSGGHFAIEGEGSQALFEAYVEYRSAEGKSFRDLRAASESASAPAVSEGDPDGGAPSEG